MNHFCVNLRSSLWGKSPTPLSEILRFGSDLVADSSRLECSLEEMWSGTKRNVAFQTADYEQIFEPGMRAVLYSARNWTVAVLSRIELQGQRIAIHSIGDKLEALPKREFLIESF